MPHTFPSLEWVVEFERQINASPEYGRAADTWEGDITFVVEGVPGADLPVAIRLDLWHGVCRGFAYTEDGSLTATPFTIRALLANWKRVITRQVGPIPAIVNGQIRLDGNLAYILRHVRAAQELVECATRVETRFPI